VNGVCNSRCDGLVDWDRSSTAVVRGGGLVGLSVLSLGIVAVSIAFAFTFTVSLAVALSSRQFFLLQGTMPLLFHVAISLTVAIAVTVKGTTALQRRLCTHGVGLLEVSTCRKQGGKAGHAMRTVGGTRIAAGMVLGF